VKKQTLILVVIGVILFIAGGAIAYASVESASKHSTAANSASSSSTWGVVATHDIPAGTTGQQMLSQKLVAIEQIPTKSYAPTDLGSFSGLNQQVLTTSVAKGQAISLTELTPSTSSISLPTGLDAVTVTLTGVNGLAGYLQPGSAVDVYANITKLSASSTLPIPCTEMAMGNIEVLDVQSTVGSYSSHPSSAGRTVPSSETLLLAVTPAQARTLEFLSQNETISVVQTQKGTPAPATGQCIGTNQTTAAP
jgi:Flp pilus assembly protein CpaB